MRILWINITDMKILELKIHDRQLQKEIRFHIFFFNGMAFKCLVYEFVWSKFSIFLYIYIFKEHSNGVQVVLIGFHINDSLLSCQTVEFKLTLLFWIYRIKCFKMQ